MMILNLSKRNFQNYHCFVSVIVFLFMVTIPFRTIAQQNRYVNQVYVPGEIIVKLKPTPEILKVLQPHAEKPRNPQGHTNLIKSEKTVLMRIATLNENQRQIGSIQIETIVPIPQFIRSPTGKRLNAETLNLGQWSDVIDAQIIPIHLSLLPNGKVMYWALKSGPPNHLIRIWDPSLQTFSKPAPTTYRRQ